MEEPNRVEIDEDEGYADSTYASESSSSELQSLSSTILNYQYENGRRYHGYRAGQYYLPNDESEQERLDIVHHVFRLVLDGGVCVAKLNNPLRILDIGTGTGIWAIDMGDTYPSAEVIGTDLSPIQPGWVPPNVRFEIDDATQNWTFKKDSFDMIHARTLGGSIRDWPKFIEQCYDHLRSGGKVEISEGRARLFCNDDSWPETSYTRKWFNEFERLGTELGLNFDVIDTIPDLLSRQGFKDAAKEEYIVPLGTWPKNKRLKEIGAFFRLQFIDLALEAYSLALFTRAGGWTEAEFHVLLAEVRKELKTNKMHIYTYCTFVTAEKP